MRERTRYRLPTGLICLVVPSLAAIFLDSPALAQITPADAYTQVTQQGGRFDIQGGQLSGQGDNLFFRFDQFYLSAEQAAILHASGDVQNIFSQVVGGNATYIGGRLEIVGAAANLYLVSPAGIVFGPDAQLNLPGNLTATTASAVGFEDGWLTTQLTTPATFSGIPEQFGFSGTATSLINLGELAVAEGQSITLLGGTVINRGSLAAPAGSITIAAVENGAIQVSQAGQVLSLTGDYTDSWPLAAATLPEWLTGSDIDHALSLTQDASGEALITGSALTIGPAPGTALIAGTLDTTTTGIGGEVQVLGQQVVLADAVLRADGSQGGGLVQIGGAFQGGGTVPTAAVTIVNSGTEISANALVQGNGGEIIVWADESTHFLGTLAARGGAVSGNGGFAEVSGKEQLQFTGTVDLTAANGESGTLLLDPRNILILEGIGTGTNDALLPNILVGEPGDPFILYEDTLESLTSANILLQALDNITIADVGVLRLQDSPGGSITFEADIDGDGIGSFTMVSGNRLDTGGRDLTISAASITAGRLVTGDSIAGNNANAAGDVQLDASTGSIAVESISAISEVGGNNASTGGDVVLAAAQAITVGNIETFSRADNNNTDLGGKVVLSALEGDITTGDIRTFSQALNNNAGAGGDVALIADNGSITAGAIETFSQAVDNFAGETGGNVTLAASENIQFEYINAEADTIGGLISLNAGQNLLGTGSFTALSSQPASVSSMGRSSGSPITIQTSGEPFQVGGAITNGTAAAITSGTSEILPTQTLTETTTQGDIQIELSGSGPSALSLAREDSIVTALSLENADEAALAQLSQLSPSESSDENSLSGVVVDGSQAETVRQLAALEKGLTEEFSERLGLSGTYDLPVAFSLGQMQRVLQDVEDRLQIKPALTYLYFVDDQLEALVVTSQRPPYRQSTGLSRAEVLQMGQEFRWAVTHPTLLPNDYLPPAQALYQALIKPIESELVARGVDNLALVLDSGLRSLPLAALHDGQQFLIERYSIGILPTFNLTNFDWTETLHERAEAPTVLAMGIAEFADQPSLPAVPAELSAIAKQPQDQTYLNEASTLSRLETSLAQKSFEIVHLATHAIFDPQASEEAYVQMWDQPLQFSQLRALGLGEADVSLLVLSACKTALGDEVAEFGFAGLAVSTGAQSALASLWAVSDEGTLGFMEQFYRRLRQRPVRMEALQQAQISMLRGEVVIDQGTLYGPNGEVIATVPELVGSGRWDFSHPVYWSAFTLIGNPW
ncbi:MAG: CHAT domain-containing protein [Cyanobacteria bacterium J06648_16]